MTVNPLLSLITSAAKPEAIVGDKQERLKCSGDLNERVGTGKNLI